ncbi:hypothetical protein [Bosea sp. ANAM02]|uniref:N-acyl amino acid synthase FeeM domain-containing protein n=1 Tax=Bosea sp. ANAM02 TaxID=2020412 RepID=UPI00140EE2F3|nr:hypothetical protein [Bosea sp. ANAM02]BCB19226.1 hypothetical protein OCUBac02_21200 [Bosea sp. ANAM02]
MDDGITFTEPLAALPVVETRRWTRDNRWPEGIIDPDRYPEIAIARTDGEMEEVGRLRYALFVERDGKRYAHADHTNKVFLEPIDKISLNFVARARDKCAVAVRATWAHDTIVDPHLEQVVAHADLAPEVLDTVIVHSRLVVRRSMSARGLLPVLFQSMFRGARMANARFCLAATRSELIPLFERFGFCQLDRRRPYFDEVAGWMNVLLLDLHDRERLTKSESPFVAVYDEFDPRT